MPIGTIPPKGFRWDKKRKMRRQKRMPRKELRKLQRECKHRWEEQPGEPPEDVCIHCGLARR